MGVTRALALLALFTAGCDCAGERPPPTETPVEPTPPEEELPTPDELCEAWTADHRGWCEPMGSGAWWMELEGEPTDCGMGAIPPQGEVGRQRVGYTAVDGRGASQEWIEFDDCDTQVLYGIDAHTDYDGDDHHEVLLKRQESYVDGGDTYRYLLSFTGDAIAAFDGLPEIAGEVYALRDADEDGRLDIETTGPHQSGPHSSDCCDHVFRGGPRTLWHALPDGSFSRTDEVATAHLREACPDPDAPLFTPDEWRSIDRGETDDYWPEPEQQVVCLRLHGRTAAQIRAQVEGERAATPCAPGEEVWCEEGERLVAHIIALAEVDPGVRIPTL